MKPRICKVKHDPPHAYGDCVRACVATMIDRDDVPHTITGSTVKEVEKSWSDLRRYLKTHGKYLALVDVTDPWDFMKENNPDIPYLLLCRTAENDHCVVCKDGKVFHDPSWYRTKIVGPNSIGFWIIGLIGDLV